MFKSVYFIGIGGVSLSGMAKFLFSKKIKVAGSDKVKSEITESLKKLGIKVFYRQSEKNLKNFNVVVYTDAISEKDKEFLAAKKLNKKIYSRAQFLEKILQSFKTSIAIAGCHGKTTATAMTHFALKQFNPTSHIGGFVGGENFFIGDRNVFITEACEYKKNLRFLKPNIAVILNIGFDHADCYKNLEDVIKTFQRFASNVKKGGSVLVCGDDENCKKIVHKNKLTFGLKKGNDFTAKNIKEGEMSLSFNFYAFGKKQGHVCLNVSLYHNVYNALAALSVAYLLKAESSAENLEQFKGAERRNEFICDVNGAKVFHDYAHHPDEIEKIIQEHKKFCQGRLIVAFESHTYSRTKALQDRFKTCFLLSDKVFILPIYPAREKPIKGIDGKFLANLCGGEFVKNYKTCVKVVKKTARSDDHVLILGAGSIYKLCHLFK